MNTWKMDRETREHYLPFSCGDDVARSMKVYKTAAGDYAITCHIEDYGHGGEVEYEPTLARAKTAAEAAVQTGHWHELAP